MFVIEHASCGHTFETLMPNMIHTNYLLTEDGILVSSRPSQLAELSRSEFDPELFSHSTYVKFFCDIRSKSAVFNILRQNMTISDIGNG